MNATPEVDFAHTAEAQRRRGAGWSDCMPRGGGLAGPQLNPSRGKCVL